MNNFIEHNIASPKNSIIEDLFHTFINEISTSQSNRDNYSAKFNGSIKKLTEFNIRNENYEEIKTKVRDVEFIRESKIAIENLYDEKELLHTKRVHAYNSIGNKENILVCDSKNIKHFEYIYSYNTNEELICQLVFLRDNLFQMDIYQYNDVHQIISYICYREPDKYPMVTEYVYDNSGNLIEKNNKIRKIRYSYDQLNRLVEEIIPDVYDGVKQYSYDSEGNLNKIIEYSYDFKFPDNIITFSYSNNGKKIIAESYCSPYKPHYIQDEDPYYFDDKQYNIWGMNIYEYDNNMNLIRYSVQDYKQEYLSKITYSFCHEYEYDNNNNLIKEEMYDSGKKIKTIIYQLEYFESEIE